MYHPPFYRRILPWLYAFVFFCVAPLVLFYTAGYRYNLKKAQLERNGTLITDSTPNKAEIFLDDIDQQDTTATTFQYLTPGYHLVRFVLEGYHPWEKLLEIKPELATFADQVHLWRTAPLEEFVQAGDFSQLEADPQSEVVALLEASSTQQALHFFSNSSGLRADIRVAEPTQTVPTMAWRPDGRVLLIDTPHDQDLTVRPTFLSVETTRLPADLYHWNETDLIAEHASATSSKEQQSGDFRLSVTSSSQQQLLFDRAFRRRAFSLPDGNWTFGAIHDSLLFLHQQNDWLGLNPKATSPFLGRLLGDRPRWDADSKHPRALFVNGTELWLWDTAQTPTLLRRQSEPIREAAWHPDEHDVFFATDHEIFAIELDDRNGRQTTPIATFDQIQDFAFIDQQLLVAGTKNGQTGLWRLTIE